MSSTRDDVIRIFGQPKDSTFQYYKSYDLKEGKVEIEYSRGLCGDKKKEGWNVPEFTVTRIFFNFTKPINPKNFPISSTEFRKYPISDVPDAFTFENEEEGINYFMTSTGKIADIEFYPSNKYDYLFCDGISKP